ncbi:MAG: CocE/NonD family hydrolase [Alphaproteobacteria bacterium]|nr:CocE/NonD family hydrolase [Alphaproteobacteria bacterium]
MNLPGPTCGTVIAENVMVPMRDGVRLATDIYRPAAPDGTPLPGPYPTLVYRTSYDKSNAVAHIEPVARFFTPRGYVCLLQDLRGRGRSEGKGQYFHVANINEGRDGYDTIEWAAAQPWCNGRIGMLGSSHMGIVQNAAAMERPPHLKALWVDVAPTKFFDGCAREGGAQALHMFGALFLHGFDAQEIRDDMAARKRLETAVETLRDQLYRIPFKPGHTPLTPNPNFEELLLRYQCNGVEDDWWRMPVMNLHPHIKRFADIPVILSSGWYDPFALDMAREFVDLVKQNKSTTQLLLGPWNHGSMKGDGASHVGEVEFGPEAAWGNAVYNRERLRWFERWLRDVPTGVENEPPVRVFVMGGGDGKKSQGRINHGGRWIEARTWPLPDVTPTPWYLISGGRLEPEEPSAEAEPARWVHDPEHPVPTLGAAVTGFYEWSKVPDDVDRRYIHPRGRMRTLVPDGPLHQKERPDQVGCRAPWPLLAERPDVMVFQTEPLKAAVEIAGNMEARLWVSSSQPDTDITVKLLDVHPASLDYPDSFHMPLVDSILRLRFHGGFDKERLLEPGKAYAITVRLPPVANLFATGHRIRVDIASSNFPRFDINPGTGEPLGCHTHTVKTHNTLWLDRARPSHIVLPIRKA